jgi:hypothetical protein
MKSFLRRTVFALFLLLAALPAQAAEAPVDFFHFAGKFYGVIAVIGVIFIGLIAFLVWTDLKLGRLEKQVFSPKK